MMSNVTPLARRQLMIEKVVSVEEGDTDWPASNFGGLISWLLEHWHAIPEEYRDSARCEITSVDHLQNSYAHISINYQRPETNEEMEKRAMREREQDDKKRQRELALLCELEKKYRKTRQAS